jgi:hypothetical protein
MEKNERKLAREQLIDAIVEGHTFWEVSAGAPVPVKEASDGIDPILEGRRGDAGRAVGRCSR